MDREQHQRGYQWHASQPREFHDLPRPPVQPVDGQPVLPRARQPPRAERHDQLRVSVRHALRQRLAGDQGLRSIRPRVPDQPLRGPGSPPGLRRGPPADPDAPRARPASRSVLLVDGLRERDGGLPSVDVDAVCIALYAVYFLRCHRLAPPQRPAQPRHGERGRLRSLAQRAL